MKILIVDDIQSNILSLEALINEYFDIEIEIAEDGEEALRKAFDIKDIDLILLDVRMPKMDGFEVARYLQTNDKTKDIPIIFVTAEYKENEFRKKGFAIGAIAYLTKPIQEDQLINMIKMHHNLFQTNEELKELNKTLNKRIEDAVVEAKEKDSVLFQQSKMAQMGEMLSMIAHQWRQPLGTLSSISVDLSMKLSLQDEEIKNNPEKLNEFLEYIKNRMETSIDVVQDLSQIISDFRDFYKKNEKSEICTIDIPIKNSLSMMDGNLKKIGVDIENDYKSKNELNIYSSEVAQVFLSIFQNSNDNFIEKKIKDPRIKISTIDSGENCIIEISDNGGGIEPEYLERIFEPYFSTKQEKNGTGLGLYMSKLILEKHHNGTIDAVNKDNGVCFRINI